MESNICARVLLNVKLVAINAWQASPLTSIKDELSYNKIIIEGRQTVLELKLKSVRVL